MNDGLDRHAEGAHVRSDAEAASLIIESLRVRAGDLFELEVGSFSASPGDLVALVGQNGAGKSLFLETLVGQRRTSDARGRMLDAPLAAAMRDVRLKRRIGAQLQRSCYPQSVRVADLVRLHRQLYGPADRLVFHMLDVDALAGQRYGTLSRGQRQRVDLFMAMAHRPDILLLDEPSTGLDAEFSRRLAQHLREQRNLILMASHDEAELAISNRVAQIESGALIRVESADAARTRVVGHYKLELGGMLDDSAERTANDLEGRPGTIRVDRSAPDELVAYGTAPFDPLIAEMSGSAATYTAGQTSWADFLKVVARNA